MNRTRWRRRRSPHGAAVGERRATGSPLALLLGALVAAATATGCAPRNEATAETEATRYDAAPAGVTALGRLEPRNGVRRVAGPSRPIMLQQVIEAITLKAGGLLDADRASLLLADEERDELWSLVAQSDADQPLEIRIPAGTGIAGHVSRSGALLNVADAYDDPRFNAEVDRATGYRTGSVLALPVVDRAQRPFAVLSLLNKRGGAAFDAGDERTASEIATGSGSCSRPGTTRAARAALPRADPARRRGGAKIAAAPGRR